MSEIQPKPRPLQSYDFKNDPHGFTREDMLPADGILDVFLASLLGHEDTDAEVGVTISVGGSLISGVAIPRGRWQKLWFSSMREAAPALTDAIEPQFNKQLQATAALFVEREKQGLPIPALKFLHLRDVTMWQGSQKVHLPVWRARLDRLDGWSVGTLG